MQEFGRVAAVTVEKESAVGVSGRPVPVFSEMSELV